MDTYEQLIWLLRLAVIVVVSTAIATIFFIASPAPETADLTADTLAGKIAFGADIYERPGVVSERKFLGSHQDLLSTGDEVNPLYFAATVTVRDADGARLLDGEITHNRHVFRLVEAGEGLGGMHSDRVTLPVDVRRSDGSLAPGILHIEVIHRE